MRHKYNMYQYVQCTCNTLQDIATPCNCFCSSSSSWNMSRLDVSCTSAFYRAITKPYKAPLAVKPKLNKNINYHKLTIINQNTSTPKSITSSLPGPAFLHRSSSDNFESKESNPNASFLSATWQYGCLTGAYKAHQDDSIIGSCKLQMSVHFSFLCSSSQVPRGNQ